MRGEEEQVVHETQFVERRPLPFPVVVHQDRHPQIRGEVKKKHPHGRSGQIPFSAGDQAGRFKAGSLFQDGELAAGPAFRQTQQDFVRRGDLFVCESGGLTERTQRIVEAGDGFRTERFQFRRRMDQIRTKIRLGADAFHVPGEDQGIHGLGERAGRQPGNGDQVLHRRRGVRTLEEKLDDRELREIEVEFRIGGLV